MVAGHGQRLVTAVRLEDFGIAVQLHEYIAQHLTEQAVVVCDKD